MTLHRNALLLAVLFLPATVQAAPDFCQYVAAYQQTDGVEYESGVDAEGNPVVPSDLNENMRETYESIVIPVEIDLIKQYNLSVPDGVELQPTMADMVIHEDGRIDYNGQDMTEQVTALCAGNPIEKPAEAQPKEVSGPTQPPFLPEIPAAEPSADDGQAQPDPVNSGGIKGKLIEGQSP